MGFAGGAQDAAQVGGEGGAVLGIGEGEIGEGAVVGGPRTGETPSLVSLHGSRYR